jgi:hypothetical protein
MGDKPGKKQTKRQQKKAPQEPNQQRLKAANHNSRRALSRLGTQLKLSAQLHRLKGSAVVDDCIFDELGHLQKGLLLLVEDTPVTFLPDLPPAKEYNSRCY